MGLKDDEWQKLETLIGKCSELQRKHIILMILRTHKLKVI